MSKPAPMSKPALTEVSLDRARIRKALAEMSGQLPPVGAILLLTEAVLLLGELVECAGLGNMVSIDDLAATVERVSEEPRKTA